MIFGWPWAGAYEQRMKKLGSLNTTSFEKPPHQEGIKLLPLCLQSTLFSSSLSNAVHIIATMFYAMLEQSFLLSPRLFSKILALTDPSDPPGTLQAGLYCYPDAIDEEPRHREISNLLKVI